MEKLEEMHGKRILDIEFADQGFCNFKDGKEIALLSHEYYGDHSENWVVIEKDGVEVRRYNTTSMMTIEWWDEKAGDK